MCPEPPSEINNNVLLYSRVLRYLRRELSLLEVRHLALRTSRIRYLRGDLSLLPTGISINQCSFVPTNSKPQQEPERGFAPMLIRKRKARKCDHAKGCTFPSLRVGCPVSFYLLPAPAPAVPASLLPRGLDASYLYLQYVLTASNTKLTANLVASHQRAHA